MRQVKQTKFCQLFNICQTKQECQSQQHREQDFQVVEVKHNNKTHFRRQIREVLMVWWFFSTKPQDTQPVSWKQKKFHSQAWRCVADAQKHQQPISTENLRNCSSFPWRCQRKYKTAHTRLQPTKSKFNWFSQWTTKIGKRHVCTSCCFLNNSCTTKRPGSWITKKLGPSWKWPVWLESRNYEIKVGVEWFGSSQWAASELKERAWWERQC